MYNSIQRKAAAEKSAIPFPTLENRKMTDMQTTNAQTKDVQAMDYKNQRSSVASNIPTMSPKALQYTLLVMCLVPVTIILALFSYMPPVYEGQLECKITAAGLPSQAFYKPRYDLRPEFGGGELIVENLSDQDWTHLNLQINHHYQIHDSKPIAAGEKRVFKLERFLNRTGARFKVRYNELNYARVYARRPSRDRATYACNFEKGKPVEIEDDEGSAGFSGIWNSLFGSSVEKDETPEVESPGK